MSFPKAKLQRFNEIKNYTPSPADYNVSAKNHVAGAAIPKSERFSELRSPASSENGSLVGQSVFRTPTVLRKIKSESCRKAKPTELFQSEEDVEALKEKIVECNNKDMYIQELLEQTEDMKLQLRYLENILTELNEGKTSLEMTLKKTSEDHEKSLNSLRKKHSNELQNLNERINAVKEKIQFLKKEYNQFKDNHETDLANLLEDILTLESSYTTLTKVYNTLINNKTKEIEMKDEKICSLEKFNSVLEENNNQQLNELRKGHELQIDELKSEMLRTVTKIEEKCKRERQDRDELVENCQKTKRMEINKLRKEFENDKSILNNDFEAKYKQLEENYKETAVLAEMQMKETCNEIERGWKIKMVEAKDQTDAILKECQAIAEYNIIQCEIEKNQAIHDLTEERKNTEYVQIENKKMKIDQAHLSQKCKELQSELSKIIIELNHVREHSAQELEKYKTSIKQAMKDKHMYEITVFKTHKTIEALKKRLLKSDKDVEQLKAELEATEDSKLEAEGKCNQLMEELQLLATLCDDIEEQHVLTLKATKEKVVHLEQELIDKVNRFKQQSEEEISATTEELIKTKKELSEVTQHFHNQQQLNDKAQNLIAVATNRIEELEGINNEYAHELSNLKVCLGSLQEKILDTTKEVTMLNEANVELEVENKKLNTVIELMQTSEKEFIRHQEELKQKCKSYEINNMKIDEYKKCMDDLCDLQGNYDELNEKYGELLRNLKTVEIDNCELRRKVAEQDSLIAPFREYLEAYELEYKTLMGQKKNAENEAKAMGLKYAEILGHQNQKQKIKHLIDLKRKNFELASDKNELEQKVRVQMHTIEKLKKELMVAVKSPKRNQQIDDKENFNSPNRTINSNRVDSPGTPLKDRN